MSNNLGSMGDVTLNQIVKGFSRYRPFILAVAAVALVVAVFPGKQSPIRSTNATSNGAGGGSFSWPGGASQQTAGGAGSINLPGGAVSPSAGGGGGAGGVTGGSSTANVGTSGPSAAVGTSTSGGTSNVLPVKAASTVDPWCDTATGRIKIPSLYAPPCVPPLQGSNGGATYQGVTATSITVAVPYPQPNAEAQAVLAAAGDNDTQSQVNQTTQDYVNEFMHHVNTYGRTINLKFFESNVNPADSSNPAAQNSQAQADAITVVKQLKAFASLGDATDPQAFENYLVANQIPCISCTTTLPASYYLQRAPYVWGNGLPDETEDYSMRAEVICDEINPYPPQWVGGSTNPEVNLKALKHRVYGLLWPGTSSNEYQPGEQFFVQRLQQECGITFKDNFSYDLTGDITNPAEAQQQAGTFMAKFSTDGVSDVVFVGDPVTPVYFTSGATKQQYFPEWIQTGSALTDTAIFGRVYDQSQWVHNFGFSALADRVQLADEPAYSVYSWEYQKAPPAASGFGVQYALAYPLVLGINLAGPQLTPATYQCGMPPYTAKTNEGQPCVGQNYPGIFGYPISPTAWRTRVTNPVLSWGDKLWPWDDYNQTDDGTLVWWDPNATGPAENGVVGKGLYQYPFGGKRYMYGSFPKGQVPWFDRTGAVTVFPSLPSADKPPSYPYKCYYLC